MKPSLFTFDIFGTVLDWRAGLGAEDFDRIVDVQGALESERFRSYAEIVAESLVRVRRLDAVSAARFGAKAGTWPLGTGHAVRDWLERRAQEPSTVA